MKEKDFVIAIRPINGIVINSVGIIKSIFQEEAQVYFVGKNEEVIAPFDSLHVIDVEETGDQCPLKICNVCHILKPTEVFPRNQNQAGGRIIRRPTCEDCRKDIDGKRLTAKERSRLQANKPPDKTIFVCPICEKRTIVAITTKIVADHDHDTGMGREWICDSCNTGLGRFKDDIAILEVAIEYLKRFENDESEGFQVSLFDL